MKEPKKIRLDPETPSNKDVPKIPMPPISKTEWDLYYTSDDLCSSKDLEILKEKLDQLKNEDNSQNNS